jgi:hypothetical protein
MLQRWHTGSIRLCAARLEIADCVEKPLCIFAEF